MSEFISNFFIILDGEGLSEHVGKRVIIVKKKKNIITFLIERDNKNKFENFF